MKTAFIITIFAVLAIVFFPVTFVLMTIESCKSYTKKELEEMGIDYDYH